jgi:hypothetical protein
MLKNNVYKNIIFKHLNMQKQDSSEISHTVLPPQVNFDIKLKKLDITSYSEDEFNNLLEKCKDKTVCVYFSKINEERFGKILDVCSQCSYLDTSQQIENIALVYKFSKHSNLSAFLTHMTYEQYGEMVHPLKMMMEEMKKEPENKIE